MAFEKPGAKVRQFFELRAFFTGKICCNGKKRLPLQPND
jgi:hypothetical protein